MLRILFYMVYVDSLFHWSAVRSPMLKKIGSIWCHLTADSELELVDFAQRLGRHPAWLQNPGTYRFHFDLCPTERSRALELGALPVSRKEMVALMKRRHNSSVTLDP